MGDENVLKLSVAMVAQSSIHSKTLNRTLAVGGLSELCLNKAAIKKEKT